MTLTIEQLLEQARAAVSRLSADEAFEATRDGAVILDIREQERVDRDGRVPGAVVIPRNVLEWRCAPRSQWRDERVSDPERVVIVMCHEGYQSSLAAATLKRLGLLGVADLDGGFLAWRAAGLPLEPSRSS